MNDTTIIETALSLRAAFDSVIASHSDDEGLVDCVLSVLEDNELLNQDKIKEDFEKNAEKDRLLKIGVVGAVKSGKSSLLNALFFDGVDILPKAATPMTAALTELSYGDKCEISIDFFTEGDIQTLKAKAGEYQRKQKDLTDNYVKEMEENWLKLQKRKNPNFKDKPTSQEQAQWKKNASQQADNKLKMDLNLSGSYDQYEKIKNAGQRKTESERFEIENIKDIAIRLEDYVGSSGRYMPFTSKVTIKISLEPLKEICVIDTPGFNDPVPSRDERARLSLRECDVVLILSPAGKFISSNDKEVMSKITTKNGIRELYLISSQFDNQIFGMEIMNEANGELGQAINNIKSTLANVARKNLEPINRDGIFNELITNPESRLFPSSGICESMRKTFDQKTSWDSGKQKVWENLVNSYPDYFSDSDKATSLNSLKRLGNIDVINKCIFSVKERKQAIFLEKLAVFSSKYNNAAKSSKTQICEYLTQREKNIKEKNISQIEKEIEELQQVYNKMSPQIEEILEDTIREWRDTVREDYLNNLTVSKMEVKTGIDSAKGTGSRSWTTGHWFWKENHTETFTTADVSIIEESLDAYIDDYNTRIPYFMEKEIYRLTKKIAYAVQKTWTENLTTGADSLIELRSKVRSTLSALDLHYDVSYKGDRFSMKNEEQKSIMGFFSHLSNSSELTQDDAKNCLHAARTFAGKLDKDFKDILDSVLENILQKCKSCNFSKQVMDGYIKKLEKAKSDIEKPKLALETLRRIRSEVEKIEC